MTVLNLIELKLLLNSREICSYYQGNVSNRGIISTGLKTGMYYLRTRAAVNAIQFTVDQTKLKELKGLRKENAVPKTEEKEKVC